ncbi:MAG: 5'-methylthioadenosine/S-adenosylhomocysteine nucleosidase [Muribaculaceae bacterium]|nr:5'-methylthioadenosine/S-adenosylhomocysteine nucleosidase [Muribaculaceae bacterium]
MKIAIIVAMDKELQLLLPMLENLAEADGGKYHTGRLGGHDIVVAKCGIGKVNAALGVSALLDAYAPDMVLNTGVAGGTGATANPAKVLDVVLATDIAYHDVWCGPGTVPGQAAGCPARFGCPLGAEVRAALGAREGLLASGDIFVDRREDLDRILALYPDALAVDMESAAMAQTCSMRSVPFVCLRVVSDTPGEGGNAAAYEDFWTAAPTATFHAVERLLKLL